MSINSNIPADCDCQNSQSEQRVSSLEDLMQGATTLLTDSRALTDPQGSVFFAIRTATGDGHNYIKDLYNRGVRRFVVTDPTKVEALEGARYAVVRDSLEALQEIARAHRQGLECQVIGITGRRGKTTVKEWLQILLSPEGKVTASPRSYNSQIGVPLSVWCMDKNTEIGVFETGISEKGQMERLEKIIRPTIGIFTNAVATAKENFEGIEDEEALLLKDCKCLIYNKDDRRVSEAIEKALSKNTENNTQENNSADNYSADNYSADNYSADNYNPDNNYGKDNDAVRMCWSEQDKNAPVYVQRTLSNSVDYTYKGQTNTLELPFTETYDLHNILHCLCVMLYLNIKPEVIAERILQLPKVFTRLNVIEGVNNSQLIYDGYTCQISTILPALETMERRADSKHSRSAILSDLENGTDNDYKALAHLLKRYKVSHLVGIGQEITSHKDLFEGITCEFYPTTEELLENLSLSDFANQAIVIKGLPEFGLNRLNEQLEARHHETVLEVNLDAMCHNYDYYKSKINPTTGIICMVKASGYGAGSLELARTLQSKGASYLAVAVVDEGVDLRNAGITMPIMVMNPKILNYRAMFANHLEPEVYSFEILQEMIQEGRRMGIKHYPIHIKLDTGMHRFGFITEELPKLTEILNAQDVVKVSTVFSHLATADCLDMDEYTINQLTLFERSVDYIASQLPYPIRRHILNSAGITRFTQYQGDFVRLGLGLYGYSPLGEPEQRSLRPVSRLTTVISAIRRWPAGSAIGYSRKGMLKRDSVIATIPIGYADGLNRHFGNGTVKFSVNGTLCPTVGNICMDACMIDVTDCQSANPGDEVEIFGPQVPLMQLSDALGTIPYEILTSVSTRVKRVYYRE